MELDKQHAMLTLFGEYQAEVTNTSSLWGPAETKRITDNIDLFERIIREAFDGVQLVVGGHHIMFTIEGEKLPQEVASADTLIFDHRVAKKIWGTRAAEVLAILATSRVDIRDGLLRGLYESREKQE